MLKHLMGTVMPDGIGAEAYAEYRRCFSNPATIHAACEDYRAATSIDLEHDEADMDKKISCPVLALWAANGLVGRKYDVLSVWKDRATRVSGKALPGGHWQAEELPNQTLAEIKSFPSGLSRDRAALACGRSPICRSRCLTSAFSVKSRHQKSSPSLRL